MPSDQRVPAGGMSQDHFGPDAAARYDDDSAAMFGPEVVGT